LKELPKIESIPRELEKAKESEQNVDEEEQARAAKKLKASENVIQSGKKNEDVPNERTRDIEGMGEHVSNMQNKEEKLDEKNMSHNIEVTKNIMQTYDNEEKAEEEEEREEELVDFEDSQDKLVEKEEEEMLESQESFNTKV
jgi:hypothetical protein